MILVSRRFIFLTFFLLRHVAYIELFPNAIEMMDFIPTILAHISLKSEIIHLVYQRLPHFPSSLYIAVHPLPSLYPRFLSPWSNIYASDK